MPYDSISDLPSSVCDSLPKAAQQIDRAAFNDAWQEYSSPESRRGNASREDYAAGRSGRCAHPH